MSAQLLYYLWYIHSIHEVPSPHFDGWLQWIASTFYFLLLLYTFVDWIFSVASFSASCSPASHFSLQLQLIECFFVNNTPQPTRVFVGGLSVLYNFTFNYFVIAFWTVIRWHTGKISTQTVDLLPFYFSAIKVYYALFPSWVTNRTLWLKSSPQGVSKSDSTWPDFRTLSVNIRAVLQDLLWCLLLRPHLKL